MLNVEELEKKHKQYKLKSYTPYLAISLGASAAILSISFFIMHDFSSKPKIREESQGPVAQAVQKKSEEKQTPQIIAIEDKNQKEQGSAVQEVEAKQRVQLSPSLNFIKRIEAQAPLDKKETDVKTAAVVEKKVQEPLKHNAQNAKKENKKEEVPLLAVEEVKESIATVKKSMIEKSTPTATSTIDIKRRDDEEDIKHVIKRFNVNHSPALSLFVAKKYYQLGDYEQAYNYSLITNDINNNIEASWLIFSKSLVKLGKKEQAVETLKKYIKHSDSSQARQLLDEIISGKFQ